MSKKAVNKKTPIAETADNSQDDFISNYAGSNNFFTKLKSWWILVLIVGLVSLGALGAGLKYLDDDAKREIAKRNAATPLNPIKDESLLNAVNPFLSAPNPTPAPQLSKEYIYAGSRLLALEDANASAAPPADLAIWRPSSGVWWVMGGQGSQQTGFAWGTNGDTPVPGDYDGDGKTDFMIFRPSNGYWYGMKSSDNSSYGFAFGLGTDQPAVGDYDGDGKTDVAVFRPSAGEWYIKRSSDNSLMTQSLGTTGDRLVQGDYDGDGRTDVAVWRPSNHTFYIVRSTNLSTQTIDYGVSSDDPTVADYDGDGRADLAIRRTDGYWHISKSSANYMQMMYIHLPQQAGDIAVPNDYDADGKVDVALWRPSNGDWYIKQSSRAGQSDELRQEHWGQSGDIPVPAYYRR
jgi:spore coat protein A, manganese oxidase